MQREAVWLLCALSSRPDMDKILVPKLKDIIKRHQGHLVDNIDDATHIIHPPTATNDDGLWTTCLLLHINL